LRRHDHGVGVDRFGPHGGPYVVANALEQGSGDLCLRHVGAAAVGGPQLSANGHRQDPDQDAGKGQREEHLE
jgi:hypothetical protein